MIRSAVSAVRTACIVLGLGFGALVVVLWAAAVGGWTRFVVALIICAVGAVALSRPVR